MTRGVEIYHLHQFSRSDLWNWSILLEDGPICTASWKEVAKTYESKIKAAVILTWTFDS